jgi:integrase
MAYIQKRKIEVRRNGRKTTVVQWVARYRDPSHRERSKTFRRKVDAEVFLTGVENAKLRGEYVDPRLGQQHYREWVGRWWASTTNLRPSTRARDEAYMRTYVLPRFGDAPLASLSQENVTAWVADLSARGLAPATVQKAHQLLSKSLRAAVAAGRIAKSPCHEVPLPRVEPEEMRFLNPEEVIRLAEAIHPRYKALVLLGAYGGLRLGELAGLRRQRLDLLHGKVEVAEILVEVDGHLHVGPPKTRAGRRKVGLPPSVVRELESHLATWPGSELVFTAPEGGPLRTHAFRRRFWVPAVLRAGLPHAFARGEQDGICKCGVPENALVHDRPLRPHDLRHTAVALWIEAAANPKEVAVKAGHTSVAFTLDRYGHLFPEADERLRQRLDAMFSAVSNDGSAKVQQLSRGMDAG